MIKGEKEANPWSRTHPPTPSALTIIIMKTIKYRGWRFQVQLFYSAHNNICRRRGNEGATAGKTKQNMNADADEKVYSSVE